MIDYFAHAAVFDRLKASMKAMVIGDPQVAKQRDELLDAVNQHADLALLGAFFDHVVAHAASDGKEIDLVAKSADLWTLGLSCYSDISDIRQSVEHVMLNPSDAGSVALFNGAAQKLKSLQESIEKIDAGQKEVVQEGNTFRHIPRHPRQSDAPATAWNWMDRFLARRTDAFVRAVFSRATDSRGLAFGFGVLSSYAGNVVGSSYIGHVVGGPRRLHRFRERMARNAIGAWFSSNGSVPTLEALSQTLHPGSDLDSAKLPTDIAKLASDAFLEAFGEPPPDLAIGFSRTAKHLHLLSMFVRPRLPAAPPPTLSTLLSRLQTGVVPLNDGNPTADPAIENEQNSSGLPPTNADPNSQPKTGAACGIAILVALLAVVIVIDCLIQVIDHGKCTKPLGINLKGNSETRTEDDGTVSSTEALVALSDSDGGAHLVQELYNSQISAVTCFSNSLTYLAQTGLIYPDKELNKQLTFRSFLSIPAVSPWPPRELSDPLHYHEYPNSPLEQPTQQASNFPPGSRPDAILAGIPGTPAASAVGLAQFLWSQIAKHEQDSTNFDMDADRGINHPCWKVGDGTSVRTDPVKVENLNYADITD